MRTWIALLLSTLSVLCLAAQDDTPPTKVPVFEVSSVRHNTTRDTISSARWFPGRFSAVNTRLDMLVLEAFAVPRNLAHIKLAGGLRLDVNCTRNCSSREEVLSARFDIQATIPDDLPAAQRPAVLRAFLEERFKLRARFETDNRPGYDLTLTREDRLGPRLRRSSHNCEAWAKERNKATTRGVSLPSPTDAEGKPLCGVGVASRLADFVYVRKSAGEFSTLVNSIRGDVPLLIVDRTGLSGTFEWELTYAMPGFGEFGGNLKQKAPTLEDALQEQLGLRLVRSTAPLEVLVIDSVSMPTSN
jgi:uncharacterized protein (TIGR03435 family)